VSGFGASAPAAEIAALHGVTVEGVRGAIERALG
jgi:transketolase